jgi:predicted RNA methylase
MPVIPATFTDKGRFDVNPNDFFETPVQLCRAVWNKLLLTYPRLTVGGKVKVLDPGCGTGNWGTAAAAEFKPYSIKLDLVGVDIDRQHAYYDENHKAYSTVIKLDYTDKTGLAAMFRHGTYHFVVGNPPYSSKSNKNLALDFALAAFESVRSDGIVALMYKAEFLGSKTRYETLFKPTPPHWMWYLDRVPFRANSSKTNTIDYAMFVWDVEKMSDDHYTQIEHLRWKEYAD